jgi:hypothetical protein
MGTIGDYSPVDWRPVREVDQSPTPSGEVRNKGSYTSAPSYALTGSNIITFIQIAVQFNSRDLCVMLGSYFDL